MSVCVPAERVVRVSVAPVPRSPSRLDVHWIEAPRSPSSGSAAAAERRSGRAASAVVPTPGVTMVTTGAPFGGRTTTVRCAFPMRPVASGAAATTVCVPWLSTAVMRAPDPSGPSRSEVQVSAEETSPSVASIALALNTMGVAAKSRAPGAGSAIVTTGAVGVTAKRSCAVPVAPSESVTAAVRVCRPSESRPESVPPPPSGPSRSELHRSWPVTSPSKSSLAVAASVTRVPAGTDEPSAGPVMATAGGAFVPPTRTTTAAVPTSPPASVTPAVTV